VKRIIVSSLLAASVAGLAGCPSSQPKNQTAETATKGVELAVAGTYKSGMYDAGAAEISAYDPTSRCLFVTNAQVNTVDILDISDINNPQLKVTIELGRYGAGINSIAVMNGIVATAVESKPKQSPGHVVFFDTKGNYLNKVTVGALPDMLTFSPDGSKVVVANEGEPNSDYTNDPEGSVSIIDIRGGVKKLTDKNVRNVSFASFNGMDLSPIRVYGPNASVAQDLEPEYITVSDDSKTAWVTLQENNAIAIIDLQSARVKDLVPLGIKDFSLPQNAIDASNKDGMINIQAWPVVGMYQPDSIAHYEVDGKTYLVIANEGDSRDYEGYSEEARVKDAGKDYKIDPTAYPNFEELSDSKALGRLKITTATGDLDGDGDIDLLHAYGGRSFSILDENAKMIYDSANDFERIIAKTDPANFNSTNDENGSFDDRSDDKGPEPEGITVGTIDGKTYAFIGLERNGGIMVYDISNPLAPVFVQFINNRDFNGVAEEGTAGDLAPEGLLFIDSSNSPNGQPLLVVTNEVSGSTTIYSIAH
jgi:DNA-binding beta-propeller fold protein YncE